MTDNVDAVLARLKWEWTGNAAGRPARELCRASHPAGFNPSHESWLPVLRSVRGNRKYTALFSNTQQAHRRGRTHD